MELHQKWLNRLVSGTFAVSLGLLMIGSQHGITRASDSTGLDPRLLVNRVDDGAYSASIHFGTCDALDPTPAYQFGLVPQITGDVATPGPNQGTTNPEVTVSNAIVPVPLDRLLTESTALGVQTPSEETTTPIACGEIAGQVHPHVHALSPGGLMIPLHEMHHSGFAGMAWLQPCVGNTTSVTIFLYQEADERRPIIGPGTATPLPAEHHALGKPVFQCHRSG